MKKIFIIIIILLSLFLHFYKLTSLTIYNAEIAQNYLAVKNLINNPLNLNGPNTSHSWLKLSSFSYYLFFPVLALGNFHPLAGAYFWAATSVLIILLNYLVIKRIFNEKTAIISSLLLTVSPGFMNLSRLPHFYNYVIPLTYLLFFFLWQVVSRVSKSLWPAFLIIGLAVTLHASSLIFLPICLVILFFSKTHTKSIKKWLLALLAFLFPNIPFLIADYQKHFLMTKSLLLWFPYKILNFFKGTTFDVNKTPVADNTFSIILNFIKDQIFPPAFPVWLGIVILLVVLVPLLFKKSRNDREYKITLFWLLFGLLALLIHKNPPSHYFVPIFIFPIILFSYFLTVILDKLKNPYIKYLAYTAIGLIVIVNLSYLFSPKFFYQNLKTNPPYIPYSVQEQIARVIIKDAHNQKYSLTRLGPFDFYENEFKDNYQYLLWYLGNEPVGNTKLKYTIVEEKHRLPKDKNSEKLTEIEGISVSKSK